METPAVYAIIEDSGTQIKVTSGQVVDVDRRDLDAEARELTFDRVLLVGDSTPAAEGGQPATIGTPYVDGASVTAQILEEVRDRKIDVVKFKRRKGYRVKRGHRQRRLRVRITGIAAP